MDDKKGSKKASIVEPTTLKILPNADFPTGMTTGCWNAVNGQAQVLIPSVDPNAMVLKIPPRHNWLSSQTKQLEYDLMDKKRLMYALIISLKANELRD